ncbi:MAG: rane carboxypeptidase, partial [Candidatus Krumholzibacteriota bacterium]|nr:rane carboxypeptidase [Candidatus Krumholzibacteriota bacterium]
KSLFGYNVRGRFSPRSVPLSALSSGGGRRHKGCLAVPGNPLPPTGHKGQQNHRTDTAPEGTGVKRASDNVSASLLSRVSGLSKSLRSDYTVVTSHTPRVPHWIGVVTMYVILAACVSLGVVYEIRTSWLQSRLLSRYVRGIGYSVAEGPSLSIRFPSSGPYDERLGYVRLPAFIDTLEAQGYMIESQARMSEKMIQAIDSGFFPLYREKNRAGLDIVAGSGETIYSYRAPERHYASYDSIPRLTLETLFFIENREAMDPGHPYKNPAIEWDRLVKGIFDLARTQIDDSKPAGGSTLATQIEKYRHSPGGRTNSIKDKMQQVTTASCRSYLDGAETTEARRRIVLDYINTVPLAAIAGFGEVHGLHDGLWAWYGADADRVNRALSSPTEPRSEKKIAERATAYRQVLSLFLAHRRPAYYIVENPDALTALTDTYLRLLAADSVITDRLRDEALEARPELRRRVPEKKRDYASRLKAVEGVRIYLMKLLGVERLYDLDRLDLAVESTLDKRVLEDVSAKLRRLRDPEYLQKAGLVGEHLLDRPESEGVVCSFTLYENVEGANLLRVQSDNFDQPLNINEGTKLELGSTAKLRTLVTYLEIIAELHDRYARTPREELGDLSVPKSDALSRWAVDYLAEGNDTSLTAMLDAAMERKYSANPRQGFFTGGGLHEFSNFDEEDDFRTLSVRTSFHRSVNLPFIRLMRDIVYYYMFRVEGSTARILEDSDDPNRSVFLTRFADYEGKKFIVRFYRKYREKKPDEIFNELSDKVSGVPSRQAMLYRSMNPDSSFEAFSYYMEDRLPEGRLKGKDLRGYFDRYAPDAYNLADQGYIARVHPLELWTASYLRSHPTALLSELFAASEDERQEVYSWLFKTRSKNAQDSRIKTILEMEAFEDIHEGWKRVGYPFDTLIPSYATAIGSSADRPAALAELVGVILNDGIRYPSERTGHVRFAANTPYETVMKPTLASPERVMRPEIAAILREALIGVVESGTAVRVRGAFERSDGSVIPVGG